MGEHPVYQESCAEFSTFAEWVNAHPYAPLFCITCGRSRDEHNWPSHSHIAPPGLQGVLVLFVWIGALDRARRIDGMPGHEQQEARRGLAQWLWLNGVRGEACWTWGQGD